MVCSRNVCLPRASILPLRYFADNIWHLFLSHGRWIRAGSDHRPLRRPTPLPSAALELWSPIAGVHFQLTSLASKPDHFVCSQTAQFGMASQRRKPYSVTGHFRASSFQSNFFYPSVSSCTFWNFNGFSPSSFFNMRCIRSRDMFSSRAIFLPLPRGFQSNLAFNFRIISSVVTVFFSSTFWTQCDTASITVTNNGTRNKRFIHI